MPIPFLSVAVNRALRPAANALGHVTGIIIANLKNEPYGSPERARTIAEAQQGMRVITGMGVSAALLDVGGGIINAMDAGHATAAIDPGVHTAAIDTSAHTATVHDTHTSASHTANGRQTFSGTTEGDVEFKPEGTTVHNPYTDAQGNVYPDRDSWLKGVNGHVPNPRNGTGT